jgi:hypothetical protein
MLICPVESGGSSRAIIQRMAQDPDRHDTLLPARTTLLEHLATDPLDPSGISVRKRHAITDAKILNTLFTTSGEDRRPAQEALRAAATAATASVSTRIAAPASTGVTAPPAPAHGTRRRR